MTEVLELPLLTGVNKKRLILFMARSFHKVLRDFIAALAAPSLARILLLSENVCTLLSCRSLLFHGALVRMMSYILLIKA